MGDPPEADAAVEDQPDASVDAAPSQKMDTRPSMARSAKLDAPPVRPDCPGWAAPSTALPPDMGLPLDAGPVGPGGWIGPPLIVAVGQGGRRLVSADVVNWTGAIQEAKSNTVPAKDLTGVAYANGLVVAVGGGCTSGACTGRLLTFNGKDWTEGVLPTGQSWLGGVAYGNGMWVAAGAPGPGVFSKDGKTWSKTGSLPGGVRALAYGNVGGTNMFIGAGDNGLRVRSTDGVNWTNLIRTFPGADAPVMLEAVTIGNGLCVAAGAMGRRIRSLNGIDWTDPAAGGTDLTSVLFSDKLFLAYTNDGVVHISSDDGRTWFPQVVVKPAWLRHHRRNVAGVHARSSARAGRSSRPAPMAWPGTPGSKTRPT